MKKNFEKYRKRLGMSSRATVESLLENSRDDMERKFTTSPSYYEVEADGELIDSIVNRTNNYEIKLIYFRRDYDPKVGTVIKHKSKYHILLETDSDPIYSFGKMEECNSFIDIEKGEPEKIYLGDDEMGRPHYDYKYEEISEPCIVRDKYYTSIDNSPIPLPEGKIEILMKYQETNNMKINKVIEMDEKVYKISDVSYIDVQNEVGVMKIYGERTEESQ